MAEGFGFGSNNGIAFTQQDIGDQTLIYQLPQGGLSDGFVSYTANGAMASATISKDGDFDNIIVAGSDATSYFYVNQQISANYNVQKLVIKVNSIGSTAPIIGFLSIWPGTTYSNFNNSRYTGYVNLATGVPTTSSTAYSTSTAYNGFLSTVAAGDIIEATLVSKYLVGRNLILKKINLAGEITQVNLGWVPSTTVDEFHIYQGIILADGNYTLLEYSYWALDSYNPKVLLFGDSISTGAAILPTQSIQGNFNSISSYKCSVFGAVSVRTKGNLALTYQVLAMRPEWCVMIQYINPLLQQNADPANGGYASWTADFQRMMFTIRQAGIKLIFVHPQTWDSLAAEPICTDYANYLNTVFPSDEKIYITTAESEYDATGFHYASSTNLLIAQRILNIINA